jgi:hypothetical protein
LDPFNKLFDEGHTALARLSNAQAEQRQPGGKSSYVVAPEISLERWRRRYGSVGVLMNPRLSPRSP